MAEGHLYQFTVALNDKTSEPAKHAEGGIKSLGEVMGTVKDKVTMGVAAITNAFESLKSGDVGEAIQSVGEGLAGVAKMLDLVVPGLGEAVSALIEVGSLGAGLFAELIQKGIELSLEATEAKEKMTAMFDAMGEGKVSGEATIEMLDNLSSQVGMTRAELAPLAKQFMAMGIRDLPALQKALTAAASATALVGEEGGAAFTNFQKKIQGAIESGGKLKVSQKQLSSQLVAMGLDLDDVAKAMGTTSAKLAAGLKAGTVDAKKFGDALQDALIKKGAGPLEKMAGSFEFLKKEFKENISKLFEDVDVTPFTDALKDLGSIFGKNTASGKAMGWGITTVFNDIFKIAAKVIPYIKKGIYELIIWSLKLYIALKPYIKQVEELWKKFHGGEQVKTMLKGFVVVMGALAIATFIALLPFIALVAVLIGVGIAVGWLLGKIVEFTVYASKHLKGWVEDAKKAAKDFIQGLIDGLMEGVKRVEDAVKNVGSKIKNGLKGVLGIHSPSTVTAEVGLNLVSGLSVGMKKGMPAMTAQAGAIGHAAIGGMTGGTAGPPSGGGELAFNPAAYAGAMGGGDKGGKGKGGDITVNVQIDGAGKSAQEITEEMVATVFERVQLEQGL